jgi:hypothetical protein
MRKYTFHHKIEFWLILFFIIRLVGITNPPIEKGHNWRQATGLMVARNFVEIDNNILYPRVDDNRGKSGITGMEFPILNYLIYIVSIVFGYTHWYGRLINLIISSIGILFFYKLISKYFNEKHAFISSLILICSIWFSFSRKTMPDTFCISLILIAIYYGLKYLEKGKILDIIIYTIIGSAGILAKIPAGIYLIIFIFPIFFKKELVQRKIILVTITVLILILVYWWYFVWNIYLSSNYGSWYNSGKNILTGFNEIAQNIGLTLKRFYFSAFQSYMLFGLFITGIFFLIKNKRHNLLAVSLAVFLVFIIYIFKSGLYFYHHNYYIIPFVPVMAFLAAYPLTLIKNKKIFVAILAISIIESIANQQQDFFIKSKERYKLELEEIADSFSNKSDLIAINGNENPQQIYLTHRKGWTLNNEDLTNIKLLNQIKQKGCKYLIINKKKVNISLEKETVFSNDFYIVYKL